LAFQYVVHVDQVMLMECVVQQTLAIVSLQTTLFFHQFLVAHVILLIVKYVRTEYVGTNVILVDVMVVMGVEIVFTNVMHNFVKYVLEDNVFLYVSRVRYVVEVLVMILTIIFILLLFLIHAALTQLSVQTDVVQNQIGFVVKVGE